MFNTHARRCTVSLPALFLVCLAGQPAAQIDAATARPSAPLWVGTADGVIRVFELQPTGELVLRHQVEGPRPLSFLAFHPRAPIAYGAVGATVQAYTVAAGAPVVGARTPADARGTHVEVDPAGRFVFLASYGGGAVKAFPLDAKGVPGAASFTIAAPAELCRKAHQVRVDPLGEFAYAPCLGDDVVQIMRIGTTGVVPHGRVRLRTGSGPRHMDFSPHGKYAYVLNELASTVYVYRRDPQSDNGAMTEMQALSALPEGRTAGSRSSDIHVSRDGRFVYAVHREPLDQIVTLAVGDGGRLRIVGRTPTGGGHSRCFALDASGGFVVLAHSRTKNVIVRRVDPKTGVVGAITAEQEVGAAAIFTGFAPRWR